MDAAYTVDDSNTIYGSYGVTDEKVVALGIESGFSAFGRRNTIDMAYHPPRDSARMKVAVRQGKTKISAFFSFENFQANNVKDHSERYELDAKLSGVESLKMSFDGKTKASKVKVSRKLDPKNRLDAEYSYVTSASKHVSLTFKHQYSKVHAFSVTTDYGARKYKVEWDCKTDNGPWTVATSFPFNARYVTEFCAFFTLRSVAPNRFACYLTCVGVVFLLPTSGVPPAYLLSFFFHSPHRGDWHIKRRFEF